MKLFTALLLAGSFASSVALADVKLAALFSDNMVLQQGAPVPVWGTASPGERVTVQFAGQKKSVKAVKDGKWRVTLRPMPASVEPRVMIVTGSTGGQPEKIQNVLVGEVWLCSGQSNMDMRVARGDRYWCGVTNEAAEVASADHPLIRSFYVALVMTNEPQSDVKGAWTVCSPATVGDFSATAYFFARELQQTRSVPIGLVTTCYGASTAQAWISRPVLAAESEFAKFLDDYAAALKSYATNDAVRAKYQAAFEKLEIAAAKAKAEGKDRPKEPKNPNPEQDQHNPCVLFNGMVAPLVPYAIRGAIWYQGESNTGTAAKYRALMETLIRNWRELWGQGDFPFLFVQLASYKKPTDNPDAHGEFPPVREAQLQNLSVHNTGMAVAIDIGEANNIHPKNKQEVGRRLALAARALVHGEKTPWSGPIYDSMKCEGGAIRLRFKHTDGGLAVKGERLTGFAIAGEDKKFVWADAKIDGDTVIVSSPQVAEPVAVRYDWADNPPVSLYNGAGLPASPFRTDRW